METLEVEHPIKEKYLDLNLNKCNFIPVLEIEDEFESDVCNTWEEYKILMKKWKNEWDAEDK